MWYLTLFGEFSASHHNLTITRFRTQKVASLLAYLAVSPGAQLREHLIDLFWPEVDIKHGQVSLRSALSALRRQLEPTGTPSQSVLGADRTTVRLLQVSTDLAAFEAALTSQQDALAIELYKGELLHGLYDEWIFPLRSHYEARFRLIAKRHIETLLRQGSLEEAAGHIRHILSFSPDWVEENGWTTLLSPTSQTPLPQPQTSTRTEPKQPSTSSKSEDLLPPLHGRLFGRDREIEELLLLWRKGPARAITLTGTGGIGKTRLSLETIHRLRRSIESPQTLFAFAPLAPLTNPNYLPNALLDALGAARSPNFRPWEYLDQVLKGKTAFLVLDNCEHLLPKLSVFVERLLTQHPQVRLLLTSRFRLEIDEEQEYSVEPLTVPDNETQLLPITLLGQAGVALFADRARRARPDFAVTPGNAATVASLCTWLEGVPLAIELLAARSGVLSPAQMLTRLKDRFALLKTTQRQSLPHHQSLEAALDWSYQLLPPALAQFWRGLSVFRGGFSAEAAAEITGEAHALHHLSQLRAASLVYVSEHRDEIRFSLLESLREFGELKLTNEERATLARKHANYFLNLAQTHVPLLKGSTYHQSLQHLDSEIDNVRAALLWSRHLAPEIHLKLVAKLWHYWEVRGLFGEGRQHIEDALSQTSSIDDALSQIAVLNGLGKLCFLLGDYPPGLEALSQSRQMSLEIGDKQGHATAHLHTAIIEVYKGNVTGAVESLDIAISLFGEIGNDSGRASSLNYRGIAFMCELKFDEARASYAQAIEVARNSGDEMVLSYALFCMGDSYALAGNQYATARPFFLESLQLVQARADRAAIAYDHWGLGYVAVAEQRYDEARALFTRALEAFNNMLQQWAIPHLIESFAVLAAQQGDARKAALLHGASTALHEQVQTPVPTHYLAERERWMEPARSGLTTEEFEASFATGYRLSLTEAVSWCLET